MRTKCTRAALGAELAATLPRVLRHAMAKGLAPAGMPFTRYLEVNGDELEIEAGLPLKEPGTTEGDIVASELPAGPAGVVVHAGPYEGLATAHAALMDWARGRATTRGPFWEVYATDPSTEPDP